MTDAERIERAERTIKELLDVIDSLHHICRGRANHISAVIDTKVKTLREAMNVPNTE